MLPATADLVVPSHGGVPGGRGGSAQALKDPPLPLLQNDSSCEAHRIAGVAFSTHLSEDAPSRPARLAHLATDGFHSCQGFALAVGAIYWQMAL